ncbi:hypothetical protein Q6D67_20865 [Haliea sp. E1-2-M8]|uniref:hypothetical protein n=1 Tax=Haliea sp. E1-2-M8 TaxID=3064706 RepID=UPI002721061C|nr:hypothetical protein [Haliea sp. E1-2-M8]MDO8864142.1 hypothetical protein [Haliea sp. E1-2-M8]
MTRDNVQTLANIMRVKDIERAWTFLSEGDDISAEKKYTLFITAHFGGRQQQVAELHAAHFRNKLDRRVMGRGKRLYKALFIEEGKGRSYNERHAHYLFEKPAHMTCAEFTAVFTELWQEVCGSDNVQVKSVRKKVGGLGGLLAYLTKDRDWQDILGNASFIADFSDNARLQKQRQQRIV